MSKSLKTLIAAVVIVGGVSSVAIADGYEYDYEPVAKSFAAPPVFAWTGFYAGMNAGWIRSESEAKLTGRTGAFANAAFDDLLPSKLSHDADGFIAGLTLGYNQKMGVSFVGGIEADIAYTDVGGSKARTASSNGDTASARVATNMDWFGTVRARAGWLASQQMLLYVTGGLAYADLERRASASAVEGGGPIDVSASGSKSDWKAGWTVGGGMEWLLGNKTTLKSEYLYYDLEDSSITIGGAVDTVRYKIENTGHIVRMGLNVALY